MNWEYLIGSEKDFEGAPDWCTHVSEGDRSGILSWEQGSLTKNGNRYQLAGTVSTGIYKHATGIKLNIVAQRRKRESKQWDGVGLPPVGCECEALIPHDAGSLWRKVKVICSGYEFNAAGEFIVVDLENTHPHWTDEFRPLRNKEQIDREDAINEMARIMSGHPTITHEAIADLIFDAGYRKTK